MKALVVPTIRESSIQAFLQHWSTTEQWDTIIVVEDNPRKSFNIDGCVHFSWHEIQQELQSSSWIISRRDSAIRSFGFLMAHRLGASEIFTLDDDCHPTQVGKFIDEHMKNLYNTPVWISSCEETHVRGLPYFNHGKLDNVMFSVGLWQGVPDYDAVHFLAGAKDLKLPETTRIIPAGQLFPFCGMNFAFRPVVTPLTYFPLMGEGYPYRRFDDIWFGIIAKRICDHLGYHITCGHPHVIHSKQSNVFENLIKESPGIQMNEDFWTWVFDVKLTKTNPALCMKEMGEGFQSARRSDYFKKLGEAMCVWADLF